MALGDLMASRLSQAPPPAVVAMPEPPVLGGGGGAGEDGPETSMPYFPQSGVLCESRHEGFEDGTQIQSGPSDEGLVSKWRLKDRMKTGCVALVLCLNISVDPPDVIKISPCARMECWIDPFSMAPPKALESIGKALHNQYERWQPKARYKLQLDPTVEEVKKLCTTCRKYARTERVLFHYNGHGVPKPTANREIWVFNKSYTQYIPLPISDLDSWLKTPSIYVFDCSAAGLILNAFVERLGLEGGSTSTPSSQKDCIILAACEANETLPQSAEFPADVFTACLTTPIKMALHWFCGRSLLRDSLDQSLIDKIPGRQNDRKTLLGELNWIFTAITDTIAWNVLPHELFQRLFRQDLLLASLFRNFLLAERIMRTANCSPISYPRLPPTHQHHMWDAWDMAAENCLSKLPQLLSEPNAEFQPSPFFTEQLTAFEVWLDGGSEHKKPPEQLPIVLQVLLSQSHRFRALVLLGRFLDMGPWAVDRALSVGIFPYVLKLLQTKAMELRQILVFIWTKILALDKSCQVDLVKDGGHKYFICFLDSLDAYPEQRAMAAFVLAVIVDGHRRGQEACIQTGLMDICLRHLQISRPHMQTQTQMHMHDSVQSTGTEPLLLQWLCLCLGKLWEDFPEAQLLGLQSNAPGIVAPLLTESQPEVRASAVFALGTLLDVGSNSFRDGQGLDEDCDDDEKLKAELNIVKSIFQVASDGSPLVRAEVVAALSRFAIGHNKQLKSVPQECWKTQPSSRLTAPPSLSNLTSFIQPGGTAAFPCSSGPVLRIGSDTSSRGISISSPVMNSSPQSDGSSQHSDLGLILKENSNSNTSNGVISYAARLRSLDIATYSQFITKMISMARDPSPRVAGYARRTLSMIGIEPVVLKGTRFGGMIHAGESSAPSSSANLPFAGLARSNSWFDMNAGNLSMNFRTPPVSPPQQSYLSGLRRVYSLEFRSHLQNSPDDKQTGLPEVPPGAGGSTPTSRNNSEATSNLLPESTIYNWSCGHFSRPLLTGNDDNEEVLVRREERERVAMDCIKRCQHSCASKLNNQIASWDTKFETGTKATLLLPFSPVVVAADENELIRVWNYEDAQVLNSFDNHRDSSEKGISKLCLINELDDNLLLAGSNDGNVRVWKDFTVKSKQKLVTAFFSVPGQQKSTMRNAIIDWQQKSSYLYAAGGDASSIHVWDLEREQLLSTIPSVSDSSISVLSASQVHGGQFAAGFMDGSVRIFDIRSSPDVPICTAKPHVLRVERVVGIGFQPGMDSSKIVSASQAGDIQFLDIRKAGEAYLTIDAHRGSLTALAVHRHAPVIVSGSAKQLVKVFSLQGEQLSIIRYYPTFMAQRIGSVTCLSFHPYRYLML
ncbi:regulatory-associated protein of TOR 2-like isoform X1 [Carex littledalei]|uniref:Regulatory-associated protein of TOR 2-like isoform X1 n=1 Tax=Carex littledalei TaxID=544730 RepID=A0A833QU00_9POAL|nr:regulatory-associated protein of TOR 2-like isoform X1 [Carex littledalei]